MGSKCKSSSSDVAGTAKKCQAMMMETEVKRIESGMTRRRSNLRTGQNYDTGNDKGLFFEEGPVGLF